MDQARILLEMSQSTSGAMIDVIRDEMIECRARPIPIERQPLVRQGEKQCPSGAKNAIPLLQGSDRIGEMLEQVVGYHKVLAAIRQHRKRVSACDDIGVNECIAAQL